MLCCKHLPQNNFTHYHDMLDFYLLIQGIACFRVFDGENIGAEVNDVTQPKIHLEWQRVKGHSSVNKLQE